MHYKTVILDANNWALVCSDIKQVLHWTIRDRPWLNIRTLNFSDEVSTFPCQIQSLDWRNANVNQNTVADKMVQISSLLMHARVKLFTELFYRSQVSSENLGINDHTENLILLHEYLAANNLITGTAKSDAKIHYENRIKLLTDLQNIKEKIITQGLDAKSKEQFDSVRAEMERLFFTNILL